MLHNFLWEYIYKNIQKVTLINDYIGFDYIVIWEILTSVSW